jgi:hypothetical protein
MVDFTIAQLLMLVCGVAAAAVLAGIMAGPKTIVVSNSLP